MRTKNFGAALLVAAAISAAGTSLAVTTALPALADPTEDAQSQQIDQAFLAALKDRNLKLPSDSFAVDLAHSTCDVLARTSSVENALRHVQNATEWTNAKNITTFGSLAVQGYCPKSMPKQ